MKSPLRPKTWCDAHEGLRRFEGDCCICVVVARFQAYLAYELRVATARSTLAGQTQEHIDTQLGEGASTSGS